MRRIIMILPLVFLLSACSLKKQPIPLHIIVSTSDISNTEIALSKETSEPDTEIPDVQEETTTQADLKPTETEPEIETTKAPQTTEIVETEPPLSYGTAGRLDIPSVGIGVALNYAPLEEGNAQAVVDREDSAAYFLWHDCKDVIADHNYQSFQVLPKVQAGDIAVVSTEDGYADEYVCVRVCHDGFNTGNDLLDENRTSIEYSDNSRFVMYTCNQDWQHITIVFWEKA